MNGEKIRTIRSKIHPPRIKTVELVVEKIGWQPPARKFADDKPVLIK